MKKKMRIPFILLFAATASLAFAGQVWTIDSQSDWQAMTADQSNLEFKDGMAVPTAATATFQSKLKTFSVKQSLQSIVIFQSPVWENWNPVPNIGPSNLGDAPVLLSLGPDNYWMFGRYNAPRSIGNKAEIENVSIDGFDIPLQSTPFKNQYDAPGGLKPRQGGYHAWQSRDMVNWVHHGSITEGFSRWMTTAEFVDGKAYFYYDYPNDQDPHLYIDDDLTDGVLGKDMGMVFKDPSHGSDCAVIRDLDGKFHVISEDWSPIHAESRSWDSPLASHAISPDGIHDFKLLDPPVDNRTTPTGKIGTYEHPFWAQHPDWDSSIGKYEIHEPEQEAYGDWAAIAIGGQYYLFGDFDRAEGHEMSVCWFTSSSINEPFTWCGNIGKGHPDPDVMFAEGQFYLATQQDMDFVSPGPWVETVEVRVGIDTNKDDSIDEWSDWQAVKESYDYIPGFSKQVRKTPARMDLSDLPKGYGYQFEIKTTDTTENPSKPILDKIQLSF